MQEILHNTENLMIKAIDSLKRDLGTVSTGRANPNLLDTVKVESYGSYMPLKQVANVSVSDSSTIIVQAWDKSTVSHIEKAIIAAKSGIASSVEDGSIMGGIPAVDIMTWKKQSIFLKRSVTKKGED